jgi:hypothetical protein
MINSWSLLYDELYGDDEMTENIEINTGTGQTVFNVSYDGLKQEHSDAWYDYTRNDPDRENPFTDPKDRARADRVVGKTSDDILTIDGGDALDLGDYPLSFNTFADNDDSISHHIEVPTGDFVNFDLGVGNTGCVDTLNLDFSSCYGSSDTPTPGIESDNPRKYKEDESIKALQDYISTTYGGHYTSDNNNVQTLDLIESVGDAESFCRSNAIKYLSRYDKKGQAKRDILKALHYSLLLYHFSGQLNETPTRGYETF